jgi:hypothetical protein
MPAQTLARFGATASPASCLTAINEEPKLELLPSGTPRIRSAA